MRRAPAATLLCALVACLAACGEKDESGETEPTAGSTATSDTTAADAASDGGSGGGDDEPSPEEQVKAAVVSVVGGGDPAAACADLVTPAYVKTAYGDEQGCRAAVAAQGSFDVKVEEIEIQDAKASAVARPTSGPNQGEKLEVELVRDGKAYRVDSAISNAPAGP